MLSSGFGSVALVQLLPKCKTVLWSLFYYLIKFAPLRLAYNESSQYTVTSKIDDRVPKVADCEAGAEDKTARAVKHKHHSVPEGQRTDPSLNGGGSPRRVFKRSVRCGERVFFPLRFTVTSWLNTCFGGRPTEANIVSLKSFFQTFSVRDKP